VIEDADSGVAAAKAAGSRCLGITASFTANRLMAAGAEWTAPDLGRVRIRCLNGRWFLGWSKRATGRRCGTPPSIIVYGVPVTQFPLARRAERSQRRDDADVRGIVGQAWWPKPIAH
jgi:hypothetical protein